MSKFQNFQSHCLEAVPPKLSKDVAAKTCYQISSRSSGNACPLKMIAPPSSSSGRVCPPSFLMHVTPAAGLGQVAKPWGEFKEVLSRVSRAAHTVQFLSKRIHGQSRECRASHVATLRLHAHSLLGGTWRSLATLLASFSPALTAPHSATANST